MADRTCALMSGTNSRPRSPWARQMLLAAAADAEATAAASSEALVVAAAEAGSRATMIAGGGRLNSIRAAAGAAATAAAAAAAAGRVAGAAAEVGKAAEAAESSAASSSLRLLNNNKYRHRDIPADLATSAAGELCWQGKFRGGIPMSGPPPHNLRSPQSSNVCMGVKRDAAQAQLNLCRSMKEVYRGASPKGRSLSCPEMDLCSGQTAIQDLEEASLGFFEAGFHGCLQEHLYRRKVQQFSQEQGLPSSEAVMASSIFPKASGCNLQPRAGEHGMWSYDESCALNSFLDPVPAGDVRALSSLTLAARPGDDETAWTIQSDQGEMTSFPEVERTSTSQRLQRDVIFTGSNLGCGSRRSSGGGIDTGALRDDGYPSSQTEAQKITAMYQEDNLHISESRKQPLLRMRESTMLAEGVIPAGTTSSISEVWGCLEAKAAEISSTQHGYYSLEPTDPRPLGDKMDLLVQAEGGGVILKRVQQQMVIDALKNRLTYSPVVRQDQESLNSLTESQKAHQVHGEGAGQFSDSAYAEFASPPHGKMFLSSASDVEQSPAQTFMQRPSHVLYSSHPPYESQNPSLRSSWNEMFTKEEKEGPEGSSKETALMSSDEDEVQPRGTPLRSALELKKKHFREKRRRRQNRNLIVKLRQLIPGETLPREDSAAVLKAAIQHIQQLQSDLSAARAIINMAMDGQSL